MKSWIQRIGIIALGFIVLGWTGGSPVLADPAESYVIDKEGYKIPSPLGYSVERVLIGDYHYGMLKNPEDLFIDAADRLYIADTDNNRVVMMDKFGSILRVFGTKEDGLELMTPRGVFVENDGDIYIADSGNARIVHLSPEGELVEQFVAPESELIDPDFPFMPMKLVIDKGGNLYVQSGNDYHGLMVIDGTNRFQGYIAPNKLNFNLRDWILREFATREQREALGKKVPPNHRNVTIDPLEGHLYTVIENTASDEIKQFNFVGINMYPSARYGEYSGKNGIYTSANLVDAAVDAGGILSVVDSNQRKVYQYDQEGNNLLVFGGRGAQTGFFQEPVGIDVDSEGLLYVLDRARGDIQVFRANHFASLVQEGSRLFHEGRYEEAMLPWQQVLAIHSNYNLAHRGVGKALYKQGEWKEAMKHFRLGEDKANYSKAFQEYRHDLMRRQFGWVLLAAGLIAVGLYVSVIRLERFVRKVNISSSWIPSLDHAVMVLFAPSEAFARIQSRPRWTPAIVLILMLVAARFIEIYFTSFHFAGTRPEFANLWLETSQMVVPFAAWVVSAWAITSIMDGESKLKQIAVASAYAMIPLIIGIVLSTLLSGILTLDEQAIFEGVRVCVWIWTGWMFLIQLKEMNDYSFAKTIWVILVTLFTMLALLVAAILFYVLLNHIFKFIKELFLEIYIRSQ
ncbi:YIP1 family protein [Paenibacillus sp. J2TS4]|uniref:YIP1 family protein n=1 Tax=Paenibacillus sp. J2TS4 TaxID=2807194 RepID=UPI001B015050|nr:YIP1 family protein [Paenibacillus sp. J2TS4]GIP31891.1 hypothetical protein J2TS4_11010 [Paenibacillus sp. J2TS4]